MDQKTAEYLLRKVDSDKAFLFCHGKVASDLSSLLRGILTLSSEEYAHHVFEGHNDFSNWLRDVVGDTRLAADIFSASQRQAEALLKARLHYLQEMAGWP